MYNLFSGIANFLTRATISAMERVIVFPSSFLGLPAETVKKGVVYATNMTVSLRDSGVWKILGVLEVEYMR